MLVYTVISKDGNILGVFGTKKKANLLIKKIKTGKIQEHLINKFDNIAIFEKVSIKIGDRKRKYRGNGYLDFEDTYFLRHKYYYLTDDNQKTFYLAFTRKNSSFHSKHIYTHPQNYVKDGRFFTHVYSTYSDKEAKHIVESRWEEYKKTNNL